MSIVSVIVFLYFPKNFGIDMTWWLQVEYTTQNTFDDTVLEIIRDDIKDSYRFEGQDIITDVLVYTVNIDAIRIDIGLDLEEDAQKTKRITQDIRDSFPKIFQKYSINVSESQFISVGKSFGQFILDRAYTTFIAALIVISLYLMFSFRKSIEGIPSFYFGLITLITLFHDIIVAPGIYIIMWYFFPELKIDLFFVTAILTILGYSINDTIVILDRIRSAYQSKRSGDKRSMAQIFEDSIQVNLERSIYTSGTLFLVLVAMLLVWPDALVWFVTLMLLGTIVGTYSSICIAAPMLYDFTRQK